MSTISVTCAKCNIVYRMPAAFHSMPCPQCETDDLRAELERERTQNRSLYDALQLMVDKLGTWHGFGQSEKRAFDTARAALSTREPLTMETTARRSYVPNPLADEDRGLSDRAAWNEAVEGIDFSTGGIEMSGPDIERVTQMHILGITKNQLTDYIVAVGASFDERSMTGYADWRRQELEREALRQLDRVGARAALAGSSQEAPKA